MKHSTKTNFLFGQSALQHYLPTRNVVTKKEELPVVLVISTYPPRECGIATYSHDMIHALNEHFDHSFELQVCALQEGTMHFNYPKEVKYTLQTDQEQDYLILANSINSNSRIELVLIQHEFGFFKMDDHHCFHRFLQAIKCPTICVFHTVLPNPSGDLKGNVRHTALFSDAILVMTQHAANVLINEYAVPKEKITIIQHGTHLVPHLDKEQLKKQYHLEGKNVLTTFGLLSSGKGIETTLSALPAIIAQHPEVVFLILGKTHPTVVRHDGEVYRESLEAKIKQLHLENHVQFVNAYLSLPELLEYLQLTDVYLFTSKDPHQTVSGTFSYAMSCGCPIVSTPIPHAKEMLSKDTGIIIDFQDSDQLAKAVNHLLAHPALRKAFSNNALERITSTSWENAAIAHASLFSQLSKGKIQLHYALPAIELAHFEKMTTHFGMIQFAIINQPDLSSGYTLDDNARAMIAMCMLYEQTNDERCLPLIQTYLNFIAFCQQKTGDFLNYVDTEKHFTTQNYTTNLSDSNGRAIWSLGVVLSNSACLPNEMIVEAKAILFKALPLLSSMQSPRSMAFSIKGLCLSELAFEDGPVHATIVVLADRLVKHYQHEAETDWNWFESYLTYANSVLPEALILAWKQTNNPLYLQIANESFAFLLNMTFNADGIKLISNKSWKHKGHASEQFGEQPIDVAYTILALHQFYKLTGDQQLIEKAHIAFNWFLGKNHLGQIMYNPCTGGCFDGLEENHVNLNQGAESTVSYLLARLSIEDQLPTISALPLKASELSYEQPVL